MNTFPLKARWILVLLLLCLGASIALNVVLFDRAMRGYRHLNWTKLHPLGSETFDAEIPDPPEGRKRLVGIGDSRAAAWELAEMPGVQPVNRALGGQTTAQILARMQRDVAPLKPDLVLIQAGVNDLKTLPLFPERRGKILTDCKTNLQAIVDASRESGAHVILSTIFPVGEPGPTRRLVWSPDIAESILEVNRFLKTLEGEEVTVFDAHALLVSDSGLIQPEYATDTLHLNQKGYRVLNQVLKPILADLSNTLP